MSTEHKPHSELSDYVRALENDLDAAGQENHRLRETVRDLEEQLEALREIEQLARELIELDAWAFIGWEPSGERKEAIENTFASLTEKLTGLDVKTPNPASEPKGVRDV